MEPYIKICIDYSNIFVVPYKDGIKMIEALRDAERMSSNYLDATIEPVTTDNLKIEILSKEQYNRHKLCTLLNCSMSDLIDAEEEAKKTKTV